MSQENVIQDLTFVAGADLSSDAASTTSKRYRAVKLHTVARQIVECAGATDKMIGILKNLPAADELATVTRIGTSKVRIGIGGCTINSFLKLGAADGKFVQGGAGADVNWAIALEVATADGDVIEAMILQSPITT
jgi:hypothetical protein